jgi:hypothetical protein
LSWASVARSLDLGGDFLIRNCRQIQCIDPGKRFAKTRAGSSAGFPAGKEFDKVVHFSNNRPLDSRLLGNDQLSVAPV